MKDIGIYKSDGTRIYGLEGYGDVAKDLDSAAATLTFDLKRGTAIIGSRIIVKKGEYGREERIIALRKVSKVDNLIDTIVMFVGDAKKLIEECGYIISDDDFSKIKESSHRKPSEEMRAALVLNMLEGGQIHVKSLDPIRVLPLMNEIYKELKPVLHLTDFSL